MEENKQKLIHAAKEMISEYLHREFGEETSQFPDLTQIPVAYTTSEDEKHEFQVCLDLIHYTTTYYVDGKEVYQETFDSLEQYVECEIRYLDFDGLTSVPAFDLYKE